MPILQHTVSHDSLGTHIDWRHEGVNPRMIDWFWSNMEKGFILWHPEQHEPLEWALAPKPGDPLGAIHIAPQLYALYKVVTDTQRNLFADLRAYVAPRPSVN